MEGQLQGPALRPVTDRQERSGGQKLPGEDGLPGFVVGLGVKAHDPGHLEHLVHRPSVGGGLFAEIEGAERCPECFRPHPLGPDQHPGGPFKARIVEARLEVRERRGEQRRIVVELAVETEEVAAEGLAGKPAGKAVATGILVGGGLQGGRHLYPGFGKGKVADQVPERLLVTFEQAFLGVLLHPGGDLGGDVRVAVAVATDPATKAEGEARGFQAPAVVAPEGLIQGPGEAGNGFPEGGVEVGEPALGLVLDAGALGPELEGGPENLDLGLDGLEVGTVFQVLPEALQVVAHRAAAHLGGMGGEGEVDGEAGQGFFRLVRAETHRLQLADECQERLLARGLGGGRAFAQPVDPLAVAVFSQVGEEEELQERAHQDFALESRKGREAGLEGPGRVFVPRVLAQALGQVADRLFHLEHAGPRKAPDRLAEGPAQEIHLVFERLEGRGIRHFSEYTPRGFWTPGAVGVYKKSMVLRVSLLVSAVVLLLIALDAGLARIGWVLFSPRLALLHGPLMVSAFFGTLIALERAVGLRKGWTYLAPILMAAGGLALTFGATSLGTLALIAGALAYVAVALYIYRLQPADFTAAMALGALLLFVGDLAWAFGASWSLVSLLWAGYLVLIIAGERLELSRFVPKPALANRAFWGLEGLIVVGYLTSVISPELSVRLLALGFLGMALWLLKYDVAWVNLRREGVHQFMGASLIAGYFWLLLGAFLMLIFGLPERGLLYDAALHAIYLGFVFSMVFGHAPVIFPAVLGLQLRYSPAFYLPLLLLHLGLILRLWGDLAANAGLRIWGGGLDALAIVLYFAMNGAVSVFGRLAGGRG